jgi:hypothetical protein
MLPRCLRAEHDRAIGPLGARAHVAAIVGALVVFSAANAFAEEAVTSTADAAKQPDPLAPSPDPALVLKPPMKSDTVFNPVPEETEQVLGGHLFMFPVLQETAFMTTRITFAQALELLNVPDAPVRTGRTYDVSALGVDESISFAAQFLHRYEASIGGAAEAYSGDGVKSALVGGAAYWFDGQLGLGMRLFRTRRTQLALRLGGAFGSSKRIEFISVLQQLSAQPTEETVDQVVDGNAGRKVVTPAHRNAVKLSFNLAHAFNSWLGFQGAFSVNESFINLNVTYDDQRSISGNVTTPELDGALTFDLRPLVPEVPLALIAEYSIGWSYVATKEPGLSKWLEASQVISGGAYYSGRKDLQVGLNVRHILTFETTQGFDTSGRPFPLGKPNFTALQLTLRYIW